MTRLVINLFIVVILLSFYSCSNVNNFVLYETSGDSMLPTYGANEFFILNNSIKTYDYGDLIIYVHTIKTRVSEDNTHFFWRIAALPGDTINMDYDLFTINGKLVKYRKTGESVFEHEGYVYDEYEEVLPNGKTHLILCNHTLSEESYFKDKIVIEANYFYALCDFRSRSFDSRLFGTVPLKNVHGKVVKEIKKKNFFSVRWEFYRYALWGHKKEGGKN